MFSTDDKVISIILNIVLIVSHAIYTAQCGGRPASETGQCITTHAYSEPHAVTGIKLSNSASITTSSYLQLINKMDQHRMLHKKQV